MPLNVIVIPADPTSPIRAVECPADDDSDGGFARWCREQVGGYLEVLRPRSFPRSGLMMWLGEEAKLQQREPNLRATRLALLVGDYIAGDVVVTGSEGPVTADCPLDLHAFEVMLSAMMAPAPPEHGS